MSADLTWLLIRKNNSFTVKKVPEGPIFSKEPGNLVNLHSYKYSGIANAKTIHVEETPSGIQIVSRKPSASPHSVKSARQSTGIRRGSGPRRAAGIAAQKAKAGYRPDLRKVCVVSIHISNLLFSCLEKKPLPEKKPRGKKAALVDSE
ncbi:ribosomal L28e protein family-domain-containing protein [Phellopilus nigrolimitatus]|nr:ribosomal L28e protein family-domain-containing protein [Phellopilus nigrolimitatus]